MSVRLHIDRLVLDGLPMSARDGEMVRATMEVELSRLMTATRPVLRSGGAVPDLPPASMTWTPGGNSADTGRHVAQAVYGALSGGEAPAPVQGTKGRA
jgi:hypothetical protein